MKFEGVQGDDKRSKSESDVNLAVTNKIHIELANRAHASDPSQDEILNWISKHSGRVREIFNDNPQLVSEYSEKPEEVLSKIEKLLYH